VSLLPGQPARLQFDPIEPIVADGTAAVDLRLRLLDRAGNALVPTGARIDVDEAHGAIFAATVDGKMFRARFVPSPRDRDDYAVLRASAAGLTVEERVRLLPRPRARLLVGAGVLAGNNYGDTTSIGPELSLLVRLPGLDGSAHAGLTVAMHQSVLAPLAVDQRAFPLFVEGAWRPLFTPDFGVHVGAAADVSVGSSRTVHIALAAQLVLGAAYRLGPGFVELDARAGYAHPLDGPTPLGVSATLGYRFGI
jgi:hypothetical protein